MFYRIIIFLLVLSQVPLSGQENYRLRLLVWEGYAPKEEVTKFESYIYEKYKRTVTLEVSYADEVDEMFSAIENKSADIISPAHSYAKAEKYNFIQKGFVLPLNVDVISNFESLIPALKNADYLTHDWKLYAIPISHGPYGLIYNKDYFDVPPNSWNVLWDKQMKGKFSISSDQYEANIYITALAMGFSATDFTNLRKIKSPEFISKLRVLKENCGSFWKGVDTPNDFKDKKIGTSWGDSRHGLKKLGQDWFFAEPKEGVTGWVDSLYIGHSLKDKTFTKRVAEEWLNFCISKEFQKDVILRGIGNDPVNLDIIDSITENEIKKHHLDNPSYFKEKRILWPELSERNQNWYSHLWKNINDL